MWWMMLALLPEPDMDALTQAADRGQELAGGCYLVQGRIDIEYRAMGLIHDQEVYALQGRLEDGVWYDLETLEVDPGNPNSSGEMDEFSALPPLLGRVARTEDSEESEEEELEGRRARRARREERRASREDDSPPDSESAAQSSEGESASEEPVQLMDYLLEALSGEVSMNTVRLGEVGDREAYVLERSLEANNRRGELLQEVWVLPTGEVRRLRTQADHARSEHMLFQKLEIDQFRSSGGLPQQEVISAKVRYNGFTLNIQQTTTYNSFRPCSAETPGE